MSTGRRPMASDKGPYSSWPEARPRMYRLIVICISPTLVARLRAANGRAGTSMCMAMVPLMVIMTSSQIGGRARSGGVPRAGRCQAPALIPRAPAAGSPTSMAH